jgi:hypothetical protein
VQAEFQADSILAGCIEDHSADLFFSSDSDLAVLLGEKCISIKTFSFNDRYKVKTIKDFELFSPDLSTIQEIVNHVGIADENLVYAKKPLFEGIKNMNLRCLLAVGVGCDVHLTGVAGITPKALLDHLRKLQKEGVEEGSMYDIIMEKYVKHYKAYLVKQSGDKGLVVSELTLDYYKQMINVFVSAMLYEPPTNVNLYDTLGNLLYPNGKPSTYINKDYVPLSLHKYIKAFARGDESVVIYPTPEDDTALDISICAGPGNGTHTFMSIEGFNSCKECILITCETFSFKDENHIYCVHCLASSQFVDMNTLDQEKSQQEMVVLLNNQGYQIAMTDKVEDIVDMYNTVITKHNGIFNEGIVSAVFIPEHPTTYLEGLDPIVSVDLSKGGSLVSDPTSIHIPEIIGVLKILCELVTINTSLGHDILSQTNLVIPTFIIDMAKNQGSTVPDTVC